MKDYKERMVEEYAQLNERIEKLRIYLNSKKATHVFNRDVELLGMQYNAMLEYRDILEQRAFLLGYKLDALEKIGE